MKGAIASLRQLPSGVWVVAATSVVLMSGFGMIVPLIPVYGKVLGATPLEIGLLMAGLFTGRFLVQIPAGLATDRFGRRPVVLGGLAGYALTCVGYATATSPISLIVFRLLQGVSAGLFAVSARSLISDLAAPSLRGSAHAIYSSSVSFGFVLGPAVSAIIVSRYGIVAPFWGSAFLCVVALLALAALTSSKRYKSKSSPRVSYRRIFFAFIGDRRVRLLAGSNMFFMSGLSVIMTLFPIAGEAEIEGGISFVGFAFTAAAFSGLIFGPLVGRLSDRIGRAPVMLGGVLFAAAEGTALLFTRNPLLVGIGFCAGGLGVASFVIGLHSTIGDLTSRNERGTLTGIVGLAGECGGMAGSLIAPLVWQASDLRLPFGLQLGFSVVSIFIVSWLWRTRSLKTQRRATISETIAPV